MVIMANDIRGWMGPDICLTVEENPGQNLNQENLPDRESNPDPLTERQRCYPSTIAVVSPEGDDIKPD